MVQLTGELVIPGTNGQIGYRAGALSTQDLRPSATLEVSAIGISNGLSTSWNNGAAWGVDSPSTKWGGVDLALTAAVAGQHIHITGDGGTILPTGNLTVNKVAAFDCDDGVTVTLGASTFFTTPLSPGGASGSCFLVTFANTTWAKWNGGTFNSLNVSHAQGVNAIQTGGNASNVFLEKINFTNFSHWAIYFVGYTEFGGVQDGPQSNLHVRDCRGDTLGNTSTPDGGFVKLDSLGASSLINDVWVEDCDLTNINFAAVDIVCSRGLTNGRFIINGVRADAGSSTLANLFFCEDSVNTQLIPYTDVTLRDCKANGGKIGFSISPRPGNVTHTNCEATNQTVQTGGGGVGFSIAGVANFQGYNHIIDNCRAIGSVTALKVSLGSGTGYMTDVFIRGFEASDGGNGITTTAFQLSLTAARLIYNLQVLGGSFYWVASGGTPGIGFGTTSGPVAPAAVFSHAAGITDQGKIATPFGTATINELRNVGTAASPTASITYNQRFSQDFVLTTVTGGASSVAIVVTDVNGNVVGTADTTTGTSATPTTGVRYWNTTGSALSLTMTGGTGVNADVVNGAGVTLAHNQSSYTSFSVPAGGYFVVLSATSSPSVTVTGSATPLRDLNGVTTLTSAFIPFGSTITFGAFTGGPPTVTATSYGASISTPFYRYRPIDITEGGAAAAASLTYEVQWQSIYLSASGGSGLSITISDQNANTLASGLTSLTGFRLDPGYRVNFGAFTGSPTFTVWRANG